MSNLPEKPLESVAYQNVKHGLTTEIFGERWSDGTKYLCIKQGENIVKLEPFICYQIHKFAFKYLVEPEE